MAHAAPPDARSARLLLGLLAARAAFGLTYLTGALRRASTFWYDPLARRFSFTATPPRLGMEWYGRTATALLAALVAFALAHRAAARRPFLTEPRLLHGAARAVGLMILVDFAYFAWAIAHAPRPLLPLP